MDGTPATGLLTPRGDGRAITAALLRLVNEPDLAGEMGGRGCARILSDFNPKLQTELFLGLLNGLGAGTRPTITVQPTSAADTGVAVLEYCGLSTASDATVVDQMAHTLNDMAPSVTYHMIAWEVRSA